MARRRKRTLVIRDPEQVKALRTPLRQEIVETLTRLGTCSVKELGEVTGRAPASLYYHIHELVEAGLIREATQRQAGKRVESVYEAVADRIVLDRAERSKAFLSALSDLHRSTLRKAERDIIAALEPGHAPRDAADESAALLRTTARLRPKAAARARRMMRELAEFVGESDDPDAAETHSLTIVFARAVPPENRR